MNLNTLRWANFLMGWLYVGIAVVERARAA